MKRLKFLAIAILLSFFSAAAVSALTTTAAKAGVIIETLREDVLSQVLNDEQIQNRYKRFSAELDNMKSNLSEKETLYFKSLLEYWMARAYQSIDDVDSSVLHHREFQNKRYFRLKKYYPALEEAVSHYEMSLEAINAYLKIEKDSEGLRQHSEVQGQMIFLRNPMYTFRTGMNIKRTLKKSLKMDPENIKSIIMDGTSDIYMPSAYGGDVDEGIKKLKSLASLPGCDREDLFNINSGIAYGLIISDRAHQAEPWLAKAAEVYPHNVYLLGLVKIVEEEKKN